MVADSVAFVVDHGREAVYDAEHFFDGYRADRDYALSTLRAARQAGARTLVLCDTNGGTLTKDLVKILSDVRAAVEADLDNGSSSGGGNGNGNGKGNGTGHAYGAEGSDPLIWGIHTHN